MNAERGADEASYSGSIVALTGSREHLSRRGGNRSNIWTRKKVVVKLPDSVSTSRLGGRLAGLDFKPRNPYYVEHIMYPCPACGQPLASLWQKSCASDLTPRRCERCHIELVLPVWPFLWFFLLASLGLAAISIWFVLTGHSSVLAVFMIGCALAFLALVHKIPLIVGNFRRTRIAKAVRWTGLFIAIAYFFWSIPGRVSLQFAMYGISSALN